MSVPPSFGDIGKSASDLFKKGYTYGQVKFEGATAAKNGCEFKTVMTSEGSRVSGSLEAKQKVNKHGLTLTGKWNTENSINLNVAAENNFLDGLKVAVDATFAPHDGRRSVNTKVTYKRPHFQSVTALNVDAAGTSVSCEDTFSYENVVGGFSAGYNTTTGKLGSHKLAVGYASSDFGVSAGVGNFVADRGMDVSGSLYHRVNSRLHVGAMARHVVGAADATSLELATKYSCQYGSTLQAKVNNRANLGVSYAVEVRPGVKLTLSSLVDTLHLDQPNHRLGLGIDLNGK